MEPSSIYSSRVYIITLRQSELPQSDLDQPIHLEDTEQLSYMEKFQNKWQPRKDSLQPVDNFLPVGRAVCSRFSDIVSYHPCWVAFGDTGILESFLL